MAAAGSLGDIRFQPHSAGLGDIGRVSTFSETALSKERYTTTFILFYFILFYFILFYFILFFRLQKYFRISAIFFSEVIYIKSSKVYGFW